MLNFGELAFCELEATLLFPNFYGTILVMLSPLLTGAKVSKHIKEVYRALTKFKFTFY